MTSKCSFSRSVTLAVVTMSVSLSLSGHGTSAREFRNANFSSPDESRATRYEFDLDGKLRGVRLPDGTKVDYVLDGAGRRIGKKVAGKIVQSFLYDGDLRPAAEMNEEGRIVSRFVYADRVNVPAHMIRDAKTWRIISDERGSPRLVVDVASGEVGQRIDYDEFGVVTFDSNPGFQPFGFAGGLYDRDTGLTRFGAREYDAQTGRWMSKDPLGFAAADTNLYAYCKNDPGNRIDPTGLQSGGFSGRGASGRWDPCPPATSAATPVPTPTPGARDGRGPGRSPFDDIDLEQEMSRIYNEHNEWIERYGPSTATAMRGGLEGGGEVRAPILPPPSPYPHIHSHNEPPQTWGGPIR
jgi:RHS repeat-associated protein